MSALRARARLTGWIAAFAVLLSALVPTLGQAVAAAGSPWVEVCTAQGAKWVQAGDDGSEPGPASEHVFDHCPFCPLHAPMSGLPPAGLAQLPVLQASDVPTAFLAAPRTLHAWVSAQPRAPPQFS